MPLLRRGPLARRLAALLLLIPCSLLALALEVGDGEVALRFIQSPQGTRVVLEFSERPDYQVRQAGESVIVSLRGSYRSIPYKQKTLDDPILDRFQLDRSFRKTDLIFTTGPAFGSVTSFEMKDPFRLVLDFQGRSTAEGAPPGAGVPVPLAPQTPVPPGSAPEPVQPPPPEARGIAPPSESPGIRTIVVDAGHGGSETGARGPGGMLEKEVTLDVARKLQMALARRLGVKVILTRESDRQISLDERTAIANHNRADLFLSIHANASAVKDARGAETYFLSYQATDEDARTLAAEENKSAGDRSPAGSSNLKMVLWDLAQSQYLAESSELAEMIQANLNELCRIESRGVKQAPFRVLMGATMPAVLVEIGFVTNSDEEKRLKDGAYRERIAEAIVDSVAAFKDRTEKREGLR